MDKELIDSYLDNIAELVVDEDKIVTYKSLSKSLGIHVNTSKQLLHTYLKQQKTQNDFPISATYLLAGKLADGSFNITIVNETDLESTSSEFVEITSEHVYSVQKCKNIKEMGLLCGVDKGIKESTHLVITSSKCVLKSKDEIKKKPECIEQENKATIKKAFIVEKEKVCLQESNKNVENPEKEEIAKSPKKFSQKKQKEKSQANSKKAGGNIANMFAKAAQKNADNLNNVKNEEKEPRLLISHEEASSVKSEKVKSIPSFFARASLKNSQKIESLSIMEEKDSDNSSLDEECKTVKSKRRKNCTPKASPKKKKGSKRKRILSGTDSNDSESNDDPPQTPVEAEASESPPATIVLEDEESPAESQPQNKRKKRKIVDKTIMHEDGYLETKKEVVFETDSDDVEEEPENEKKIKPAAKFKSTATNGTKKQSTLLTFFKKS